MPSLEAIVMGRDYFAVIWLLLFPFAGHLYREFQV